MVGMMAVALVMVEVLMVVLVRVAGLRLERWW